MYLASLKIRNLGLISLKHYLIFLNICKCSQYFDSTLNDQSKTHQKWVKITCATRYNVNRRPHHHFHGVFRLKMFNLGLINLFESTLKDTLQNTWPIILKNWQKKTWELKREGKTIPSWRRLQLGNRKNMARGCNRWFYIGSCYYIGNHWNNGQNLHEVSG